MAEVTRVNGNAGGVSNVDIAEYDSTFATSINQTISVVGRGLVFFKITFAGDESAQLGTGGKIEAVLRAIQLRASTVAYCLATGGLILSVVCDASGWGDQTAIDAANGLEDVVQAAAAGVTSVDLVAFKLA